MSPRKKQKTDQQWCGLNVVSVNQFDRGMLEHLFKVADDMEKMVAKQGKSDALKGKLLANVFYEPSTRTMCSFAAAMLRLGGDVISVSESGSSAKKGETISDTIRCLECYTDVVVLRHPVKGTAAEAAAAGKKPLLSAGDGVGEHPTQALLDLFTIHQQLQKLDGVAITMLGDLKNGRTVHSLVRLCRLFKVTINFVSPDVLAMPSEYCAELEAAGITVHHHTTLEPVIADTDVLYVTRVQKERFASQEEYDKVKDAYVVDLKTLEQAKEKMIVMHPLPRVNEIATEVDSDPRAVYFRQMENGMYVRMAILSLVLGAQQ